MQHDGPELLAKDVGCGEKLARDLLMLAGGDAELVREASAACSGVESMKAYIIDRRFRKFEWVRACFQ